MAAITVLLRESDNSLALWTGRETDTGIEPFALITPLDPELYPEITKESGPIKMRLIPENIGEILEDHRYLASTEEPGILREFVRLEEIKRKWI